MPDSATDDPAKSDSTAETNQDDLDVIDGLGDKGKAAILRERDARAKAEARVAALTGVEKERDQLRKEKTARDAAEAKDREEAAAKRGEFEELATKREQERDAATADVTRLTAENDQLRSAIAAVIDAEWKTLPADVRDLYLGADDDPFAKLVFLPKAKAHVEKNKRDTTRGNGPDPRPNGAAGPTLEKTKQEMAARMGIRRPA